MTNIFLSFLGISIPISLMIALLLLLTPFLNKRYAAKWKYWIWIVLALRLIIPLGGNDGRTVADMQPQMQTQTESESEKILSDTLDHGTAHRRVIVEIPTQMTTPIVTQPEKEGSNISVLDIISFVWMLGSLIFISVHFISYFHFKRQILKKGKIVKDRDILCLLLKLKHELHIKCTVPVIEYSEAASPMLIGFFNHILVLPKEQYNSEELFFILKHELIHLKRGDIYLKLLFVAANAVHWFNPLIWIMQKEAAVDMELSCDERVTQGTDYATRKAYTETLLSTLHKQSAKNTVLSTGFYGGKQIMKKRFKNILAKTGKKNGVAVLICAIILTVGLGTLVGCSITKENTEDAPDQLGTEDIQTDESSSQSNGNSTEAEHSFSDSSIILGDVSLSIYENKQDILEKLDEAGLDYSEHEPDYPEEAQYDSYYNVDAWMQIFFLNDVCVRLRVINVVPEGWDEVVRTSRGIHPGSTYSQMVELYGDPFETRTYAYKGIYTIYRYSINDCICEFGIPGEDSDSIYNVDIYIPSQSPIYDYGEELTDQDQTCTILVIFDRYEDDMIVVRDGEDEDIVIWFTMKDAEVIEGDTPIVSGDIIELTYTGVQGDDVGEYPGTAVKIVAESMMYK